MYTAIRGIYENGKIQLLEPVPSNDKAEILITFLNDKQNDFIPQRKLGGLLDLPHLKGKDLSIPDDFNDPLDDLKDLM